MSAAEPPTANPPTANPATTNPPTANPATTNPATFNTGAFNPDGVLREQWAEYKRLAATARSLKTSRARTKTALRVAGVLAAILGPAAPWIGTHVPGGDKLALWLAAVILALVAFFNKEILGPDVDDKWVRVRAAAEGIKSEIFRFAACASEASARAEAAKLLTRIGEVQKRIADVVRRASPPDAVLYASYPGYPISIDRYLTARVADQVDYFETKARENALIGERLRIAGVVLGALAVLAAVPAPFISDTRRIDGWIPVITVVAGALAAQLSSGRYNFLASNYQGAASQLKMRRASWELGAMSDLERDQLVNDCESILKAESGAWQAESLKKPG